MVRQASDFDDLSSGRGGASGAAASVWVQPMMRVFAGAVALVVLLWFFKSITFVLLLLLLAGAVASLLNPVVNWLPGRRSVSGTIVGAVFMTLLFGAGWAVYWWATGPAAVDSSQWYEARAVLNEQLGKWSQRLGMPEPMTVESTARMVLEWLTSGDGDSIIALVSSQMVSIYLGGMLLLFGSFYFLVLHPTKMLDPVLATLPSERARQLWAAVFELPHLLRWWLIGHAVSMVTVGVLAYAGWSLVGVKFALPLAVAAGLATLVPTIGPTAVALVALIVAATQGGSYVFGALAVFVAVEAIESYVLLPLVMREAVDLPPIITLFTLVLWASIFGPLGLILAIPINLTIWVFYKHLVLEPRKQPTAEKDKEVGLRRAERIVEADELDHLGVSK